MVAADLRLLTLQDYYGMVESGILAADERVALINGHLFKMAAKGSAFGDLAQQDTTISKCYRNRILITPLAFSNGQISIREFLRPTGF